MGERLAARGPILVRIMASLALLVVVPLGGLVLKSPPAQAYPAASCSVKITPSSMELKSGQSLKLVGHSSTTTHWTVDFNGVTHYYTGTTFTASYVAPTVSTKTTVGLTVTCSSSAGSLTLHYRIVVDPYTLPSTGSGHLPNTGGPSIWWLIVGIALTLGGAAFMRFHRQPIAQRIAAEPSGRHRR
ncbi:MAG: LPXTG cell wall anchor domain-containing protein [Marmoricola sp.]